MKRGRATATLALAALLAAVPAAADWLVLGDGGRIETQGPWEVRGGLVVFTLPNGTLSSLRGSEVDLEASRAATEEALRPPEPPAPPPPRTKATVVLTERDLPPVSRPPEEEAPAAGAGATAIGGAAAAGQDARLQIVDWNATTPEEFDGTVITGRLRNVGDQLLTRVLVEVNVYNSSGALLGRTAADVQAGPLAPERVASFEARFPNLFDVAAARFNARGIGFLEGEGARSAPETPAEAPAP